ncbi:hypothetical protein IU450_22240 [Nocardia abscessus]|uniref:hypothetical protein n=1 Tax=Nocardia abscessus TaxID=120957 RepID=UPI001894D15E|nr:hypothetical protein [Nocardia abscessus]MBF6338592.1 hypothetical protein [Nocardia abscessus]
MLLPLTIATLAARPLEASAEAPPWLPLGDLATGSSGAGGADAFPGSGSSLGPSGSAADPAAEGGSLSLGPIRIPSGSADLGYRPTDRPGSGLRATGHGELDGDSPSPANEPADSNVTADSPGAAPKLDTGSVQSACSGSAATGSALLLLGLATGSGFGSLVPGLIGPGSSGSGLGSAAVGSAATGSAVLTCLLLLPTAPPPVPMSPLQLGPPAPEFPVVTLAPLVTTPLQTLAVQPRTEFRPPAQNRPRVRDLQVAEPIPDPDAWNLMKLMTVLVVTVITVVGVRSSTGPRRIR